MRIYGFKVRGLLPIYQSIPANDHAEFYLKLSEFLARHRATLIGESIAYVETDAVPDPPQ